MVDFELGHDLPETWDWEIDEDNWWKTSLRAFSWANKTSPIILDPRTTTTTSRAGDGEE